MALTGEGDCSTSEEKASQSGTRGDITGSRVECAHELTHPLSACHCRSLQHRAHTPHRRYLDSGGVIADLHGSYLLWMEKSS